jgi:ATP phosphoribosyltransferase regulatory subunit
LIFMPNWLLPENIADVLPAEARKIEELRRRLLDHFRLYGYELVMPPMLEYLESLLCGAGQDLDLRTFKLVDQLSGRSLGIRADITTQVARIDAHLLNHSAITRLCYSGSVLHTRPSGLHATREPLQIGVEIYGHAGLEADVEIQELLLASMSLAGMTKVRLDLCHVGVFRAILAQDPIAQKSELSLYSLLEAKDMQGLKEISATFQSQTREALTALPNLYGNSKVLDYAHEILPGLPGIKTALNELTFLANQAGAHAGVEVTIDLADLRGLHYHSGATFAAYVPGLPNAVARGGRYDHIGEAFGRARPATGFSLDLKELVRLMPAAKRQNAILAPWGGDVNLRQRIAELRAHGEIVIQCLPGHEEELEGLEEFDCNHAIVFENGNWIIKSQAK